MIVLSLFDGISCARVALDRLGYADITYYASEVDKYAMQVSAKNWPDIIQLGDVRGITASMFDEQIDLLIGGSPCQDLSIAKAGRKGLDGERSGLFWEYVRIWKEVKPKWFVLENVNSMPREAKRIISETFNVEPIMINAALVSAQNRKRLFWTNICSDVFGNQTMPLPEDRGILLRDILESGVGIKGEDKSLCIRANYKNEDGSQDYLRRRYDKRFSQMVAEPIRIGDIGSKAQGYRVYSPDGKSVTLSALGGGPGDKTGLYAVACAKRSRYKLTGKRSEFSQGGTEKVTEVSDQEKAHGMTSVQTDSMVATDYTIRKLTPVECERLQSLPDGYTEGISNTQRYRCLGNAFNVEVVRHILSFMGAE